MGSYTYDPNHPHAVASTSTGWSYQYDANGNMTTRDAPDANPFTYKYDAENRLVQAWQSSAMVAAYVFDGDGNRIMAIEGGATTVYIGNYYEYVDDNETATAAGSLNNGIACQDAATGSGYLMYSAADVYQRFSASPPYSGGAAHFVCVKYDGGQWKYDNNSSYVAFSPLESDLLVALIDFSNDTITGLTTQTTINGIAAGYASGNLTFTPDRWAGAVNDGEFTVGGSSFTPFTMQRLYYYFGSQRIAMRENGTLYWFVSDHLGSTSKIANADGSMKAEMRYSPWGRVIYNSGTMPTDFSYTGQRSASIDLMFYNARWYDVNLGRFAQADTVIPNPGNPMAFDRYAYVLNNPIKYSDPSGHNPECGPDGMWCDDAITADEYFISFTTAGNEKWEAFNQAAVLDAVHAVAKKLGSYMGKTGGLAWMTVFGFMTFQMGGCDECDGVGGYAASSNLIKFASFPASWREDRALRARNLVTHELGHAFSQGHGRDPEYRLGDAQKNSSFPNRPNFPANIPDGWTGGPGGYYGYASTQNVLTWQISVDQAGSLSEEFADMFLGWTYGVWDHSEAGRDRSNFMIETMFTVLEEYKQ